MKIKHYGTVEIADGEPITLTGFVADGEKKSADLSEAIKLVLHWARGRIDQEIERRSAEK
jgi:hypothetical protein